MNRPAGELVQQALPRLSLAVLCLALASPMLSGCGGLYYGIIAGSASSKLADARELGADRYAIYEYTQAKAQLHQASMKAGEAAFGDAAELAEAAETNAERAIELTRQRRGLAAPKPEGDEPKSDEGSEGGEKPAPKENEP